MGALRTPGDTRLLANGQGDGLGVYPVHLVLLHTGRVLMFSGGWEGQELLHRSWTFDPATYDPANPTTGVIGRWFLPQFDDDPVTNVPPPTTTHDPDIDLFCTHHVQVEDGRILTVGGDGDGHVNDSIHFYDPVAERWSRIPEQMVAGRWYPTAVTMPDGSVTVFSGDGQGVGLVRDAELMSPGGYAPRVISGGRRQVGGVERALYWYPGMFLVPGGRLFYIPISFSIPGGPESAVLAEMGNTSSFRITDATSNPPVGVWQDHGVRPANVMRQEGTAVLLSPAQAGRIALIGGGQATSMPPTASVEILETQGASPAWVPAGQMHRTRGNVNAVLLPDATVLIFGGTGGYKWDSDPANDQRRFAAEIWDPSIPYDPANPTAAFTETGEMHRSRMYHSGGILLPDGRVLVAGGEDGFPDVTAGDGPGPRPGERSGTSQRTMELYEPPYVHNGPRPAITGITDTGGLDGEIHYGGTFTVVTAATNIAIVALMRPGATTHHTDTEQRHVPLVFWPVEGGYRARVPGDASIIPPGHYMVWTVDDQGRPCQRASFVHLRTRSCTLVTDRSQFSLQAVESQALAGVAGFDHSFYVIVDGYRPEQLGITTTTPTQAQLSAWAPAVTFTDSATGTPVADLDDYVTDLHLEVASLTVRQRITFEFGVRFTGTAMFPTATTGNERRPVRLTAMIDGRTCVGEIDLFLQPNPFMVDGPIHWLSEDLRVFQIRPNGSQSGIAFPGGGTPEAYLQTFLNSCDSTPDSAGHPFRVITTDQNGSRLELAATAGGEPVYNFAIARVHYQAASTPADDVRVFFRAFTTAATSMEFRPETYPWDAGTNLPLVGAGATDVLTIPFFSVPRSGVATTGDTQNVKDLPASGAGAETFRYFGAWLDINSTTPAITDPADGVVKSVQNLIRGRHQCLVGEIHFGPDPIEPGATPASHENLSQRNLAIVESDNPGPADAHTIAHTFQLTTTFPSKGRGELAAAAERAAHYRDALHEDGFDELMIDWGGLPEESEATLYLPDLSADKILAAAALRYGPPLLEKVDEHTVRCRIADMSFVPLAASDRCDVAGLLTVNLPATVRTGQSYRIVVRQHSRVHGRVMGTFELFVPVHDGGDFVEAEARLLAVLRSIARNVPRGSAWFTVFERYLDVVAGRVRALGGDPDMIGPSPEGTVPAGAIPGGGAVAPAGDDCCEQVARGLRWMTLLLAVTICVLLVLILLVILES